MSQLQERIAQFRQMTSDDPDNELGHYRLGLLLAEAGQHEEAVKSYRRTLEIAPQFSKIYQLLAQSPLELGRKDEAVATLKQGWQVADERGDRMPRDAMAQMLQQLGEAVPQSKREPARETADAGGTGGFRCQRMMCQYGASARKLDRPPFSDELGRQIQEKVCAGCWNEWLRNYSIKVINEGHLDLSSEHGQAEYDRCMRLFLGFE